MSEASSIRKTVPIIAVTWILSLVTTLAVVYYLPAIFPPSIADGAVTATKLADGSVISTKIADDSVTSTKIVDGTLTTVDIADDCIENAELAHYAIPFASTYSLSVDSTDSTLEWVDMDDMALSITLGKASHVIIMFSVVAWTNEPTGQVILHALVDSEEAYPGAVCLNQIIVEGGLHTRYEHCRLPRSYYE